MQTKVMNVLNLCVDGDTQSRFEMNEEKIEEYANLLSDGHVFPPPIAVYDGANDIYWVADGFHRIAAHKLVGKASLTVEVRIGSKSDAQLISLGANIGHGMPRTNFDKRAGVELALRNPMWAEWSDARIAEICFVTRQMVSDVRRPQLRAERNERAAKKASGPVATKPDAKPGTEVGVVTVSKGKPPATVAPRENPDDAANAPTPQELHDEDRVRVLSEEVDRLTDRLAVEAMDATEEEKSAAAETIATLRRELAAVTAERDAMSSQFNLYVRENNELKSEIVRMRKKLDQATGKTPAPAPKGKK